MTWTKPFMTGNSELAANMNRMPTNSRLGAPRGPVGGMKRCSREQEGGQLRSLSRQRAPWSRRWISLQRQCTYEACARKRRLLRAGPVVVRGYAAPGPGLIALQEVVQGLARLA